MHQNLIMPSAIEKLKSCAEIYLATQLILSFWPVPARKSVMHKCAVAPIAVTAAFVTHTQLVDKLENSFGMARTAVKDDESHS